jgi:hypothetical protein
MKEVKGLVLLVQQHQTGADAAEEAGKLGSAGSAPPF